MDLMFFSFIIYQELKLKLSMLWEKWNTHTCMCTECSCTNTLYKRTFFFCWCYLLLLWI